RTPGDTTSYKREGGQKRANVGERTDWWQEFTRAFASITLQLESGVSAETITGEWGVWTPDDASLILTGEAAALEESCSSIPYLPLPQLPDLEAGAAVKAVFPVRQAGEWDFEICDPEFGVELAGGINGNKATLAVSFEDLPPQNATINEMSEVLQDGTVTMEVAQGMPFFERMSSAMANEMAAPFLQTERVAIQVEGTLELTSHLPRADVVSIYQKTMGGPGDDLEQKRMAMTIGALFEGDTSHLGAGLDHLIQAVHAGYQGGTASMVATVGLRAGAKIGAVEKAELAGGIQGGLTKRVSFGPAEYAAPTLPELKELLTEDQAPTIAPAAVEEPTAEPIEETVIEPEEETVEPAKKPSRPSKRLHRPRERKNTLHRPRKSPKGKLFRPRRR
ncbi:MAG: hypothetical protein HN348_11285, partial [Proteobacteria bacterium]|nr:hypothetical protein [Pseudomonadota bacterium]